MNIHDETLKMKLASPLLSASSLETRNKALALIRESLNAHKEEIFEANRKDLALAEKQASRLRSRNASNSTKRSF